MSQSEIPSALLLTTLSFLKLWYIYSVVKIFPFFSFFFQVCSGKHFCLPEFTYWSLFSFFGTFPEAGTVSLNHEIFCFRYWINIDSFATFLFYQATYLCHCFLTISSYFLYERFPFEFQYKQLFIFHFTKIWISVPFVLIVPFLASYFPKSQFPPFFNFTSNVFGVTFAREYFIF